MTDLNRATGLEDGVEEAIGDMFVYHAWDDRKVGRGAYVREALEAAVKVIIDHVPPCPDRSVAIRKIREARMDCNSAITFDGKY